MVQYTLTIFKNGILETTIPNLGLYEAYQIAKPLPMNQYNNRWHVMMYLAVAERIAKVVDGEPLLVAYEEPMGQLDCVYKYIHKSS